MTYVRRRPSSPSGGRVDQMRASTGNLPVGTTANAHHSSTARPLDRYSSTRTGRDHPTVEIQQPSRYWESSGLRLASSRLEAQPISTKTYRDQGNNTKSTTEYALRPRSNTDAGRRPLSVIVPPSTNRQSPVPESDYERTRSPRPKPYYGSEDTDPYIYPATSPRGRYHYRSPRADESDPGRLTPSDRESRARTDRGKYRGSGSGATKGYPASGSLVKYREKDVDDPDAYSYTNPREQFDRDSVAGQQFRHGNYGRKERPRSMTGLEGYRPQLELRREPREYRPPRGADRLRPEDGYRSSNLSPWSSPRAPFNRAGDDGYSSYQEDYGGSRDYRRSRAYGDRNLRDRPQPPHGNRDDKRYEAEPRRRNRDDDGSGAETTTGYPRDARRRDYDYNAPSEPRSPRGHDDYAHDEDGKSGGRRKDDAPRRRSRRKEDSRRGHSDSDADDYTTDDDRKYLRPPGRRPAPESPSDRHRQRDDSHREQPRGSDIDESDSRRSARRSRKDTTDEEDLSDRHRKSQAFEPERNASREPDTPPKGILKPPRDRFPEDKNAVREGVAPLKDATKTGIPPGARWTKIDRKMVNPAALEARQERFEERLDYVIVLRVLTREEIQDLADETQKIREERYEAERRERRRHGGGEDLERRRERNRRDYNDGSDADTSSDDEEEDDNDDEHDEELEDAKAQLALETPSGSRRQPPESRS